MCAYYILVLGYRICSSKRKKKSTLNMQSLVRGTKTLQYALKTCSNRYQYVDTFK